MMIIMIILLIIYNNNNDNDMIMNMNLLYYVHEVLRRLPDVSRPLRMQRSEPWACVPEVAGLPGGDTYFIRRSQLVRGRAKSTI